MSFDVQTPAPPEDMIVARKMARLVSLETEYSSFRAHHKELAENILPRHGRFASSDRKHKIGTVRNDKIVNNTATKSLGYLASGAAGNGERDLAGLIDAPAGIAGFVSRRLRGRSMTDTVRSPESMPEIRSRGSRGYASGASRPRAATCGGRSRGCGSPCRSTTRAKRRAGAS